MTTPETLDEARERLLANLAEGMTCPCCNQHAKVYQRSINAPMAAALIRCFRYDPHGWFHLPTAVGSPLRREGDSGTAKLRYWGLIASREGPREDGAKWNGWWRVTREGRLFVVGAASVSKYADIYDGRRLLLHGPPVTIRDALGTRFDYDELMGYRPNTEGAIE